MYICQIFQQSAPYGVATISRMHKNIGLFCKRDLQKRPIFCKETYIFKHPTHRSHPIVFYLVNLVVCWTGSHTKTKKENKSVRKSKFSGAKRSALSTSQPRTRELTF